MNQLGDLISVGIVAGAGATLVIAVIKGLLMRLLSISIDRRISEALTILVCFTIGFLIQYFSNGFNFQTTVAQSSVIYITASAAYAFITRPTGINDSIEDSLGK